MKSQRIFYAKAFLLKILTSRFCNHAKDEKLVLLNKLTQETNIQ